MEKDVSDVLLQIYSAIIESDQYLEWSTFNDKNPFKVQTLLEFLSDEDELVILESEDEE
jgi:hypothetical protein